MLVFETIDGTVLEPEVLQKAQKLEQAMKDYEFIAWQYSLTNQLTEIHHVLSGQRELPKTTDMIAQEMLMAEMAGELPLDRVLSEDQTMMRSLALSRDVGGAVFVFDRKRSLRQRHRRFSATIPNIRVDVTGDGFIATVGIDKLIKDLFSSVFLVFGVIFAVLLIIFGAPLALIALIPNMIPLFANIGGVENNGI